MVHFCAVPGCSNNSNKKPELLFHRLPLKDKKLIKIWIHKIGRKNLPLNGNTRICSEHFVASANRHLRPGKFPSINLPVLSTTVSKPSRRRPPLPRGAAERELHGDGSGEEESGLEPVSDQACCTDLTANQIEAMEEEISKLKQEISDLKQANALSKFTLSSSIANKISFCTGFPDHASLMTCYKFLGPSVYNLKYWNSKAKETACISKKKGRPRSLEPLEEFFLVLVRLRFGLMEQDIADRFGLSCSTVSRIFTTWINFLDLKLKEIPLWPPRDAITSNMPKCFQDLYPTTRVIIDATEIYVEKPSLPDLLQMTFSSYKNNNTFKALIGISPSGAIIFISSLFSGSISDKELTRKSGILQLLERGDSIMADRGFDIEKDLIPLEVRLNIPPFLKGKPHLSDRETTETRRIASMRIHVERAMECIKNYHIFDRTIAASLTDLADQMFFVCAILHNFWPPLCA